MHHVFCAAATPTIPPAKQNQQARSGRSWLSTRTNQRHLSSLARHRPGWRRHATESLKRHTLFSLNLDELVAHSIIVIGHETFFLLISGKKRRRKKVLQKVGF